jgi:hypothetical protein
MQGLSGRHLILLISAKRLLYCHAGKSSPVAGNFLAEAVLVELLYKNHHASYLIHLALF